MTRDLKLVFSISKIGHDRNTPFYFGLRERIKKNLVHRQAIRNFIFPDWFTEKILVTHLVHSTLYANVLLCFTSAISIFKKFLIMLVTQ